MGTTTSSTGITEVAITTMAPTKVRTVASKGMKIVVTIVVTIVATIAATIVALVSTTTITQTTCKVE